MSKPGLSLKNIFKLLAPYLFLAFLCICLTPHPLQNDTFYLVKIGDGIVNHGIDLKDHYTWLADLNYTYPHFLFNLICYGFFALFNWTGLYIFSILLYILFACSLLFVLKHEAKKFLASRPSLAPSTKRFALTLPFLLSLLSVALLPIFVTARSQLLTYTVFLWEIFCLARLIETKKLRFAIILAILSWLVAITHATIWPFFFILFIPFVVELLLSKFINGLHSKKTKTSLTSLVDKFESISKPEKGTGKVLCLSLLFSLLVGLLTPGRICYTAIFNIMQGSSQSHIIEHAPLVLKNYPEALIIFLIFLVFLIFTKAKLRPRDFFLVIGLSTLSILSVRHISFLLTIAFVPLIHLTLSWAESANPKFFDGIFRVTPKPLLILVIVVLASLNFVTELEKPLLNSYIAPTEAVSFLKEHYPALNNLDLNATRAIDLEGPVHIFNEYDVGAYLLANDIPVSMDSRVNIYTKPFSKNLESDLYEDYQTIHKGDTDGFELIEKYNFTTFLLSKSSELSYILAHDANYQEIYSDDDYIIFEKLASR